MHQTSQYHLNQWVPEDRILREDFNRDNANVEAGLVALGTRLGAEEAARAAAVSAERTAREQAVSSASAQLNAAKADRTELSALSGRVDALPFVKLREVVLQSSAPQANVDVRGIDLSRYAFVLLSAHLICGIQSVYLRLNGVTDRYYRVRQNSQDYMAFMTNKEQFGYHLFRFFGTGKEVSCIYESVGYDGAGTTSYSSISAASGVVPSTLHTLNFVTQNTSVAIEAGSRFTFYGLRL